jgi:hypothetical protein
MKHQRLTFALFVVLSSHVIGCKQKMNPPPESMAAADSTAITAASFNDDVEFLKRYTDVIVLHDSSGNSKVAVSAGLQGRVMTSSAEGDNGLSFGWINKPLFESGDTSTHMNAYGGEDRLWLGPEGGQFSIYFSKGVAFDLDNWHVPHVIDLERYDVIDSSRSAATFTKETELNNYSGASFRFMLRRTIRVLERVEALKRLGVEAAEDISLVAFESVNELKNVGAEPWRKETGLLSIWILGMFNPSAVATIMVPYNGDKTVLRDIVNDGYFGQVPDNRLKLVGKTIFFKADGKYRSKIGLLPENAPVHLGSYDADNGVLTVVTYTKPSNVHDYVNSVWEIQKEPYRGDAVNAYNDGPPAPGAKPLGPFYELETSSPAAALKPGDAINHVHTTFHFKGTEHQLDPLTKRLFGVSISNVKNVF